MTNQSRTRWLVLSLVILGLAAPQLAIAAEPQIDAEVRVRETVNLNHDFNSDESDQNNFATMRTRMGMSFDAGEHTSAYIQFQDTRSLGEPANTVTSLEQVDLHQGYVHIHNAFDTSLSFQVGRQEMAYGGHRQIGNLGWSDVGRSFDGVRMMYDIEDFGWFHFFAMKTNETGGIGSIQSGSGITSNPDGETAFLGGYLHYDASEDATVEVYVLDNYMDQGDIGAGPDLEDAIGNLFTAGGRVVWDSEDYSTKVYAEGAYQFGSAPDTFDGTDINPGPDYAAHAAVAGIKYALPTEVASWLGFEFNMASGDDDPTDDEIATYQQLFPTGHGVLGYMDFVGWQNMMGYQFSAGVKPNDAWKLWASYHYFQVVEAGDNWYAADGSIRGMGNMDFDSALGSEIDVSASFSPEESLNFQLHFLMWMPGSWQEQSASSDPDPVANPAELDPAYTVYLQTTASF